MSRFTFAMNLSKAFEKDGKKYVQAKVSDTRLDFHKEHMSTRSLESMLGFAKNGYVAPDGVHQRVWLIPDHGSSFKMGEAVDGYIEKAADGECELFFVFCLEDGDVNADRLYKEINDGTCRLQLSVGGEALGRPYYDKDLKKNVTELVDVTALEHVACTRPQRSAVKAAGFLHAIVKSVEGSDGSYNGSISHDTIFSNSATPQGGENDMTEDEIKALRKSITDDLTVTMTTLLKEAIPAPAAPAASDNTLENDPKVKEYIAKQKEITDAAAREKAQADAIAKSITDAMVPFAAIIEKIGSKVGVPVDRITKKPAAGSTEIQKDKDGNEIVPDGEEVSEVEKAITAAQTRLNVLKGQGEEIVAKRQAGIELTPLEQANAGKIVQKMSEETNAISYMKATGTVLK